MPDMSTVMLWLLRGRDGEFSERYARARSIQSMIQAEEMREIVDDDTADIGQDGKPNHVAVSRAKLRAEQRRWEAERLVAPVYGPRQQHRVEHSGSVDFVFEVGEGEKK
jgi:hypothetical protein